MSHTAARVLLPLAMLALLAGCSSPSYSSSDRDDDRDDDETSESQELYSEDDLENLVLTEDDFESLIGDLEEFSEPKTSTAAEVADQLVFTVDVDSLYWVTQGYPTREGQTTADDELVAQSKGSTPEAVLVSSVRLFDDAESALEAFEYLTAQITPEIEPVVVTVGPETTDTYSLVYRAGSTLSDDAQGLTVEVAYLSGEQVNYAARFIEVRGNVIATIAYLGLGLETPSWAPDVELVTDARLLEGIAG